MSEALATLFDQLAETTHPLGRHGDRRLCPEDERILNVWAASGIPADLSTVEHACDLIMVLWAEVQSLRSLAAGLVEEEPPQ